MHQDALRVSSAADHFFFNSPFQPPLTLPNSARRLDLTFKPDFIVPTVALTANPDLIGKTGLEVFHITMKALTDANIVVFLNNHNSVAAWCCNIDSLDGLWSNDAYNAEQVSK